MSERTEKKFKGRQLVGGLIVLMGFFIALIGTFQECKLVWATGCVIFGVGSIILIIACIQAWWHHG